MFDVCVIGAGVVGSCAAYSLSKKNNNNVLLLEQFPVPHTRGSSHGQSRITRCLCTNEVYSHMTLDSFPIWKELEKEVGKELLIKRGIVEVYAEDKITEKKTCLSILNSIDVKHEQLSASDINTRFPLFNIPPNFSGIYEHDGRVLLASKCVTSLHEAFVQNGGTFNVCETVTQISPGDIITIKTSKAEYKTKSLIIAAGLYTTKLTESLGLHLPLKVVPALLTFWKLDETVCPAVASHFPSFIGPFGVYGFPTLQHPHSIYLCETSWDNLEKRRQDADVPSDVTQFINSFMKGISHIQTVVEETWFTMTPDHHFIIDRHPSYRNIVIGAGFSGSGFKMAPVTGSILADLALGDETAYDLSMFRIDRFKEDDLIDKNL